MSKTFFLTIALGAILFAFNAQESHANNPVTTLDAKVCTKLRLKKPRIDELQLVSQLPAEFPQRVTALAFHDEKLWVALYLAQGKYALYNTKTSEWKASDNEQHHQAIAETTGRFASAGGIVFVNQKLFVGSTYGESIGVIDSNTWKFERLLKGEHRPGEKGTQSYAALTFDGDYLWAAWQLINYKLPASEVQQLIKIETETGNVIAQYPLPAGTRYDMTHALAWDGSVLWHAKDNRLSAIDPATGNVTAQYSINPLKRPSGMAWDGTTL